MTTMKKTTIAALAAAAAFGLAACGSETAKSSPCDQMGNAGQQTPARQICEHYLHKSQDFNWH